MADQIKERLKDWPVALCDWLDKILCQDHSLDTTKHVKRCRLDRKSSESFRIDGTLRAEASELTAVDNTTPKQASDPAVWIDRHGDALFRFALLRLRDRELAEDIVQECFVAALKAKNKFMGDSSERTWLISILKRKIVDHFRKSSREQTVDNLDDIHTQDFSPFTKNGKWKKSPLTWRVDPAKLSQNAEFWAVFNGCLSHLSPKLADAFVLRELDHVNSDEICRVLKITSSNLWARLHRARLGLRQCLENNWFSGEKSRG